MPSSEVVAADGDQDDAGVAARCWKLIEAQASGELEPVMPIPDRAGRGGGEPLPLGGDCLKISSELPVVGSRLAGSSKRMRETLARDGTVTVIQAKKLHQAWRTLAAGG